MRRLDRIVGGSSCLCVCRVVCCSCPGPAHALACFQRPPCIHPYAQAIKHEDEYRPSVITIRMDETAASYEVVSKCSVDFALSHENKGFEGSIYVTNSKGRLCLLLIDGRTTIQRSSLPSGPDSGGGICPAW